LPDIAQGSAGRTINKSNFIFKAVSTENSKGHPLTKYYSVIFRRYDLINHLFTFGLDRKWRRLAAHECLKSSPSAIIDLCCGTGDLTLEIYERSELKAKIFGYDFNKSMLQVARKKAAKKGFIDIQFIQGDVASMPFSNGEFDCATIAFGFRNLTYENPSQQKYLAEINRVIKTGGKLVILESAVPSYALIRFFYKIYLRCFLIPIGGLISGDWKAYSYLARSSANYFNVDELKEILFLQGFDIAQKRTFLLGAASLLSAIKNR
jgi:demethylmenaquinone methyltransferase / 2-methoxy-6-polyprenyl-1,4-benzoquinol methylase